MDAATIQERHLLALVRSLLQLSDNNFGLLYHRWVKLHPPSHLSVVYRCQVLLIQLDDISTLDDAFTE